MAVAIIYPYGLEQPCLFWQTFLVRLPVLPAAPSLQEPETSVVIVSIGQISTAFGLITQHQLTISLPILYEFYHKC